MHRILLALLASVTLLISSLGTLRIALAPLAAAPSSVPLWGKDYLPGGSANADFTLFNSIVQEPDGGYLLVGLADEFDTMGLPWGVLLRLNAQGDPLWHRIFTAGSSDQDHGGPLNQAVHTVDGGYLVVGNSTSGPYFFMNYDHILKLDATGNIVWQKTYSIGNIVALVPMGDGAYLVAGSGYYGGTVLKVKDNGDVIWRQHLPDITPLSAMTAAGDGTYIIAGQTGDDVWFGRMDSAGNMLWERTTGMSCCDDKLAAVVRTSDGSFLAAGQRGGAAGSPWLLDINLDGTVEWQKTYANTGVFYGLSATNDGGAVAVGIGNGEGIAVRVAGSGEPLWSKRLLGGGRLSAVSATGDGGLIIAGVGSYEDGFAYAALRADANGDTGACPMLIDWPASVASVSAGLSVTSTTAMTQTIAPVTTDAAVYLTPVTTVTCPMNAILKYKCSLPLSQR